MADRTMVLLTPFAGEFPASNFPQMLEVNRRPVLGFDDTTNETVYWTFVAMQDITAPLTAVVSYIMATATADDVDVDIAIEAITAADAFDLDAGTSFDTVNSTDNTTVPATAGYMDQISVTLTNNDSIAAGDYVRVSLTRDAASDTAAGDMYVLIVELLDDGG